MWALLKEQVRSGWTFFDFEIASWLMDYRAKGVVHCRRGCRNCCNLAVNATFVEALSLFDAITSDQHERIAPRVDQLLTIVQKCDSLKTYLRLHRQAGFCPFLGDDGACGVYSNRPFSCRALLSTQQSDFCGTDFSTLTPEQKASFLTGLDRSIVAFPSHYVALIQDLGRQHERAAAEAMASAFGFSLYGSLPVLLYLEQRHCLSSVIPRGRQATVQLLEQTGFMHPFLLTIADAA